MPTIVEDNRNQCSLLEEEDKRKDELIEHVHKSLKENKKRRIEKRKNHTTLNG